MRYSPIFAVLAFLAAAACDRPPAQTPPEESPSPAVDPLDGDPVNSPDEEEVDPDVIPDPDDI